MSSRPRTFLRFPVPRWPLTTLSSVGQTALTAAQVTTLSNWVYSGGNLIAMRPDKQLAGLLGLAAAGTTVSEGYLLVNTASGPGAGIVGQPIQFHGTADGYSLGSASSLATLYSNSQTGTLNPAVTLCSVGPNGGEAAAFTFDLARSVVYMRQGNPAWSGEERDGLTPIRPDDLFYGAASFRPGAGLGEFEQRGHSASGRATASFGQPDDLHGSEPEAAAAVLVFSAWV